jgi:hypothetical protein
MPWDQSLDEWLASLPSWLHPLTATTSPAEREKHLTELGWFGTDELRRMLVAGNWKQLKAHHEAEMQTWLTSTRVRCLSLLQLHFEVEGWKVLRRSGYEFLLKYTTAHPHFAEVYESWCLAVPKADVFTPRLKTDSPQEAEQLVKFLLELRYEKDLADVLTRHSFLIERRKHDRGFIRRMNRYIQLRDTPEERKYSLKNTVLLLWIHGFLWCIDPLDRPNVISHGFNMRIYTSEAVRKTAKRIGLNSYSDFPDAYPPAPIKFVRNRDGTYEFDYAEPGQKFPLRREA